MQNAFDRRAVLFAGTSALAWLARPGAAFGQSSNTPDVRSDYARIFRASGSNQSSNLKAFLAAQEGRRRVPLRLDAFKAHVQNSATLKALQDLQTGPQAAAPSTGDAREDIFIGSLLVWNEAALELTAVDHTTTNPSNPPPTYGEQFGPARTSRAFAIFNLAVFEAVNTIFREYQSYKGIQSAILVAVGVPAASITRDSASVPQAIASAAARTLTALFPNKKPYIDVYAQAADVRNGDSAASKALGREIGEQAAAAVLAARGFDSASGKFFDGSQDSDPPNSIFDQNEVRRWRQDPVSQLRPALGALWSSVEPFVLANAMEVLPPPPPPFSSSDFITNFKRVKMLGGDQGAPTLQPRWPTPTTRTGADGAGPLDRTNQTFVGIFWGYDGTALLCAPMRLYNMIAISIAIKEQPIRTVSRFSQYLALLNLAMGDAGIASWTAKYHYRIPRPVTYIRGAKADDTPAGAQDPRWTPLGAPVTNGTSDGRNLTPPFPAYPSGHATFGSTLFEMLSLFFGLPKSDPRTKFTFVSDEYNGTNRGPAEPQPRPRVQVEFPSFADAESDNALSRIYIGVHWDFDATAGIQQGTKIAQLVFNSTLKPA